MNQNGKNKNIVTIAADTRPESRAHNRRKGDLGDLALGLIQSRGLSDRAIQQIGKNPDDAIALSEPILEKMIAEHELATANTELTDVRQQIEIAREELETMRRENTSLAEANQALQQQNESLEQRNYLLMHDPKTGLLNDTGFHEEVEKLYLGKRKCVVVADARGLKALNDDERYGYEAGNAMLRGVADVLKENVREADIVARHGGDEFCVVFDAESQEDAQAVANRLCVLLGGNEGALQCQIKEDGTKIYLNARVALAFAGGDTGKDIWKAMTEADEYIRLAKEEEKAAGNGRGTAGSVSLVA